MTIAVIALLLLNFGILGFLLLRPGPNGPRPGGAPGKRIVEYLQLDARQQQTFEQLKSAHHQQMLESDRAYREALSSYFGLLKNDAPSQAQQDSLQAILTQIQEERRAVTFQHFQDLRQLCTPEQKERFSTLVPELMHVILPPPNRRSGPR